LEPLRAAPLPRRLAALSYEAVLLVSVLFATGVVYLLLEAAVGHGHVRLLFQACLFAVAGVYFCWHWIRGQTLPMKTWRIRVVMRDGTPVDLLHAALRYVVAVLGLMAGGITFLWALADTDGQFLHDRIAGTRLISTTPPR